MCKELLTVVYTVNSLLRTERISTISAEAEFPQFMEHFEKTLEPEFKKINLDVDFFPISMSKSFF